MLDNEAHMLADRMNYWLEVTSGIRIERLLETRVRLEAPATKRYERLFQGLEPGDCIIHYATKVLTKNEWRGKAIAVSRATSSPYIEGKKIVVDCTELLMLPEPVEYSNIVGISPMSEKMARAARMRLQAYLFQIERSDFVSILGQNNKRFLEAHRFFHSITQVTGAG